jgi:HTH-type transcriptional regulator, transcriptional repressor of NAD biosynthesis genes
MPSKKTTRVAILGAECTGKTTLCEELKKSLTNYSTDTNIIHETLREFCNRHNRVPSMEEQLGIMHEQMKLEDYVDKANALDQPRLTLSDCAPITIAIYSELYFSDLSLYSEAEKFHEKYDLSILLSPNIGWQSDSIFRESPEAQQRFHHQIKQWLASSGHPWLEISDVGDQRTVSAMSAIIPLLR